MSDLQVVKDMFVDWQNRVEPATKLLMSAETFAAYHSDPKAARLFRAGKFFDADIVEVSDGSVQTYEFR